MHRGKTEFGAEIAEGVIYADTIRKDCIEGLLLGASVRNKPNQSTTTLTYNHRLGRSGQI